MKIALVILGLGGNQPISKQTGRLGGSYTFIFDRAYGGHVMEYDLTQEGELERFNVEAKDILAQKLHWQFIVVVTQTGGIVPGTEGQGVEELRANLAAAGLKVEAADKLATEHSCRITELEAELAEALKRGGAGDGLDFPKVEKAEERRMTSWSSCA